MAQPYYGDFGGLPAEADIGGALRRINEGVDETILTPEALRKKREAESYGELPAVPPPALFQPQPAPPAKVLPPEAGVFTEHYPTLTPSAAPEGMGASSHGGVRAVRMPDGKIVFTNLGVGGAGGTLLSGDDSRQAAESAGFMRSPNPPPTQEVSLPDTIGAPGDPSYRSFGVKPTYGSQQESELVARADAAHRAGRHGQAEPWDLKPTDEGGFTPGYGQMKENEAADTTAMLERRTSVADAAAKAKAAEAWAAMTPEDRRKAIAADEAAKRPNFNLQIIEHLQGQLNELNQRAAQIKSGLSLIVNKDNPDAKRLQAEGAAKLADIDAQIQQIKQVGGLPFKADPLGMLLGGSGQQVQGTVQP